MHSWNLPFWVGGAMGAACFGVVALGMPETNHNIILDSRAREIQTAQHTSKHRSPLQGNDFNWKEFATKVVVRPLTLLREPIVLFSCLYTAFQYAVFKVFLQSYPIIFESLSTHRSERIRWILLLIISQAFIASIPDKKAWLSSGSESASFLQYQHNTPSTNIYQHAALQDRPWTRRHGAKRLPLACASCPFIVLSLYSSAWTSRSSIHWIWPTLAGIPYGLGYVLYLNALLNYMVDSYTIYTFSANSGSSITRQMVGAMLPFAAVPMYRTLDLQWTSSL